MTVNSKLFYMCIYCILMTLIPNAAYANDELEGGYVPSQREACEMNASNHGSRERDICNSVKLFEPIVESNISEVIQKIGITKEEFPEWPFPEVYFQYKLDHLKEVGPTIKFGTEPHHALELEPDHILVSVSIGHIDDVIILELKQSLGGSHMWHKQIIYTPYSCNGDDGYGDEVSYYEKSSLGWSQAFAGDIYKKSFFSPPLCN